MNSADWIGPVRGKINGATLSEAAGLKVLLMLAKVCTSFCTSNALLYGVWQTIMTLKNVSALFASSGRDFSCSSSGRQDEARVCNETCSPSPPAPGFSGGEAEQPRSCQQLSAETQSRPSATVVIQPQGSFYLSCCGVACWQLFLK